MYWFDRGLCFDQLFSDVAYKARDRDDLIAGVDEFLDEVIVLPPGEWDPKIRIEPPKKVPSAEMRQVLEDYNVNQWYHVHKMINSALTIEFDWYNLDAVDI